MTHERIVLGAGPARVEVADDDGGRLAQIWVDGTNLLVEAPADTTGGTGWGSFPMAPWAGRIRHGRFRFLGTDVELIRNHLDEPGTTDRAHAIHGTVFERHWDVTAATDSTVEMSCRLGGALGWPYGGTARQRIVLFPDHVRCHLEVHATDAIFPATIGWHPWFVKPDALAFSPSAMYLRDQIGLPTGELVVPPAGPWDDCFVNSDPVELRYDRPAAGRVTVTSDCDHLVVYDEPAQATCVEPQSGPPDGPTIRPRIVTPTRPLARTMRIAWSPADATLTDR